MTTQPASRFQIYMSFALVYVFWGSTYLAIAIAVKNIPAALMTGVRFSIAGALMLLFCWWKKKKIRLTRYDVLRLFAIGLLLLSCGNTLLVWTEGFIPSGLASLFVAVVPIYIAVIEGLILRGDRVTGRGWIGILLGTLGLFLLLWSQLDSPSALKREQLFACGGVMLGALAWACGSILSRRSKLSIDPFTATGWEMVMAGGANLLLAVMVGDFHHVVWARSGLLAIGYLIIFGSWVGFTAFIWLLEHVPTPKVATYAYVNPVVAVFLGYLILHEHLGSFEVAGMCVIVVAVALVTSSKLKSGAPAAEQEMEMCEREA